MDYLEYELEISSVGGRDYSVAVIRSPAGEARETMHFPFDHQALENYLRKLQIALLGSGGKRRQVLSPEAQKVQDFGGDLFKALFTGEVRSCYDVSLNQATQKGKGLRLKLRILSPELAALPWEFLYDERQGEYLSLSPVTPIVRYLELRKLIRPLTVTLPLRILGMIASPSDLEPLNIEREKQRMGEATRELQNRGLVDLAWLPGQTWRDLHRAMRSGPWHVFHFIGHGCFDPETNQGYVALANEEGKKDLLKATELGRMLAGHSPLRLVLLNACEGARGGEHDIFSSSAAILARLGILAVLAMQYEITDQAAIEFARAFYASLAAGLPIDASIAQARIAVSLGVNNTLEWGTPVLYMRSPDGVLFHLEEKPTAVKEWVQPRRNPPPRVRRTLLDGTDDLENLEKRLRNYLESYCTSLELLDLCMKAEGKFAIGLKEKKILFTQRFWNDVHTDLRNAHKKSIRLPEVIRENAKIEEEVNSFKTQLREVIGEIKGAMADPLGSENVEKATSIHKSLGNMQLQSDDFSERFKKETDDLLDKMGRVIIEIRQMISVDKDVGKRREQLGHIEPEHEAEEIETQASRVHTPSAGVSTAQIRDVDRP